MKMRIAGIVAAILACSTGIVAAVFWWRSSQVQTDPIWPDGAFGLVEPGEQDASQDGWISGIMKANSSAAALNAKAALWTGASVLLSAAASLFSIL
jgi:hypothetical protein